MLTTKLLEAWFHPDHDLHCHCTQNHRQRPVRSRMLFINKLSEAFASCSPRGRRAKKQEQEQKMEAQRKAMKEMRNAYARQVIYMGPLKWQRFSRHIRILPRDLKLMIFEYWIVNNPPSIEINWKTCLANESFSLIARMKYPSLHNGHLSHVLLTGMSEDDYPKTLYSVLFHTVPLEVVVSVEEYKSWRHRVWTQEIRTMSILSTAPSFLQLHDRMCLPKRKQNLRFRITAELPHCSCSLALDDRVLLKSFSQAHLAEEGSGVTVSCNLRDSAEGCPRGCMIWVSKFYDEFLELGVPKTGIALEVMPTPRPPWAS